MKKLTEEEEATNKKNGLRLLAVVGVIILFVIGFSIGNASSAGSETKAVTKTKTIEVTPKSCLTAIEQSRNIANDAGELANITAIYPPMIAEAAKAGVNMNMAKISDLTDKITTSTGDLTALTKKVTKHRGAFDSAAKKCEAK